MIVNKLDKMLNISALQNFGPLVLPPVGAENSTQIKTSDLGKPDVRH